MPRQGRTSGVCGTFAGRGAGPAALALTLCAVSHGGMTWLDHLRADPLPWLLADDTPTVRAATLHRLLGESAESPDVRRARAAAMDTDPIKSVLAAQDPAGWWVKPGPGYAPKYQGTVWQVIFLDQLGADPAHPQVARACDYVLDWCPCSSGGFGASGVGRETHPPPSAVIHCLNGAIDAGVAFLFSRDPADADYPMGWGNTKPNSSWFKPGFPIGYVSDVLQTLDVLAELGHGRDPRLARALAWVEAGQNAQGRWTNRYAYNGKTWIDIEHQGQPSKWVTLRACTVLRAAYG